MPKGELVFTVTPKVKYHLKMKGRRSLKAFFEVLAKVSADYKSIVIALHKGLRSRAPTTCQEGMINHLFESIPETAVISLNCDSLSEDFPLSVIKTALNRLPILPLAALHYCLNSNVSVVLRKKSQWKLLKELKLLCANMAGKYLSVAESILLLNPSDEDQSSSPRGHQQQPLKSVDEINALEKARYLGGVRGSGDALYNFWHKTNPTPHPDLSESESDSDDQPSSISLNLRAL